MFRFNSALNKTITGFSNLISDIFGVLAIRKMSEIELIIDNFTKTRSRNSCQLIKMK